MHVAVTHQREMGVDAFGREGMGQRFIDRHVFHGDNLQWRMGSRR
jgi:hypothetical protein